ncbi:MAG: hypothetical protein ABJK11_00355 [Balneola sp.]
MDFLVNNYQWIIGIIIGGGAERIVYKPIKFKIDEGKVYKLLENTTGEEKKYDWRTTKSIASDINLTKERVYEVCSKSKKIKESKGNNDGVWSLRKNPEDEEGSIYNERGAINLDDY